MTKYEIKNTTQFKKDYKLAKRRGLDINLLKKIVTKLANGEPLDTTRISSPIFTYCPSLSESLSIATSMYLLLLRFVAF